MLGDDILVLGLADDALAEMAMRCRLMAILGDIDPMSAGAPARRALAWGSASSRCRNGPLGSTG
jgi:hypothetical protein